MIWYMVGPAEAFAGWKGDMMQKKLYRSNNDKMLCGVCAGIAEYFGVDATLVRLLFVLFTVLGGAGVLLYIIAAIVIPKEPEE